MRVPIIKMGRLSKNKNKVTKKLTEIKNLVNSDKPIFIKKVPQHPRDRRKCLLKKLIKQENDEDVLFIKNFHHIQ